MGKYDDLFRGLIPGVTGAVRQSPSNKDFNELNIKYNLPFKYLGDTYEGKDFRMMQIDHDRYELAAYDTSTAGIYSISPNRGSYRTHIIDASMAARVIAGDHLPHLDLYRPTKEELRELDELNKEYERWRRNRKLGSFRKLPSHLRQEIVDEAILKNLMTTREEAEPLAQDFEGWKRMQELEAKKGPFSQAMFRGVRINVPDVHYNFHFKYGPIIDNFTLEELSNAHLEASLEDELKD